MSWSIIDAHSAAKVPGGVNEDRLVFAPGKLCAVIDGATDKAGRDYGGTTGGALASDTVRSVLEALPAGTSPRKAVDAVTAELAAMRREWHISAADPVAPEAAVAVVDFATSMIWRVGDVHIGFRVDRGEWTFHPARKRVDEYLAGARAVYLQSLIAAGTDPADLVDPDPGRELIRPALEQQGHLANTVGALGYGVVNGRYVPDALIEVWRLPDRCRGVVLASDGYLAPAPDLDTAEHELHDSLKRDRLRIGEHPATKGVGPDAASFDDRTYARISRG